MYARLSRILLTNIICFRAQDMDVSDLSELAAPFPSSPAMAPSPAAVPFPGILSELDYR